jgi:hypothetical protein
MHQKSSTWSQKIAYLILCHLRPSSAFLVRYEARKMHSRAGIRQKKKPEKSEVSSGPILGAGTVFISQRSEEMCLFNVV